MGLGAHFDTGADGEPDLHLEGGHHARRVLHAECDRSGHEVHQCLSAQLEGTGITVLTGTRLIDLIIGPNGDVCGVTALSDGNAVMIPARCVVLATGGIGALWSATSNPSVCTGDGMAAALRAGLTIRNPEFMQFHPTVLFLPGNEGRSPLISEAVRGEGAVLLDVNGRRIMTGVHPLADLAPRDIVSAAEHEAMIATGSDHVLLDATGFGEDMWRHRFPTILTRADPGRSRSSLPLRWHRRRHGWTHLGPRPADRRRGCLHRSSRGQSSGLEFLDRGPHRWRAQRTLLHQSHWPALPDVPRP